MKLLHQEAAFFDPVFFGDCLKTQNYSNYVCAEDAEAGAG